MPKQEILGVENCRDCGITHATQAWDISAVQSQWTSLSKERNLVLLLASIDTSISVGNIALITSTTYNWSGLRIFSGT